MAVERLVDLPLSGRRAFGAIQRGTNLGMSSRALERVIRGAGISISRTTVLRAMRIARHEEGARHALRFVGLNKRPDPVRLPVSSRKLKRRFSFTFDVQVLDREGQLSTFTRRLSIDTVLTRAQLESRMADALEEIERYDFSSPPLSITLTGGVRSRELVG